MRNSLQVNFLRAAPAAMVALFLLVLPLNSGAQQSAADYKTSYRYNAVGQVTGVIEPDPDGAGTLRHLATRNTYNGRGFLTLVEQGRLSSYQSDSVAPAQWSGFTVHQKQVFTYDDLGRKLTEAMADAGGAVKTLTQFSYDSENRVSCKAVRMKPAAFSSLPPTACVLGTEGSFGPDRITQYFYEFEGHGQITREERAVGTPLQQVYASYSYDDDYRVEGITDANGNYTHQTYDASSRLKRMYFPSKTTPGTHSTTDYEEYTYDDNHNRTVLRKRDGRIINYVYDDLNQVVKKDVPGTIDDVYYGYDLRGLQLYARFGSSSGQGITNTLDGFGGLATSTTNMGGVSRTLSYRYDANGNRTRVTYADGKYFTYAYDGLDRSRYIYENGGPLVVTINYDHHGRPSGPARTSGAGSTYTYDPISRLGSLTHNVSGTANDVSYSFGYSPASQVTSRTTSNDTYVYSEHSAGTENYTVNGLNQYTAVGGAALGYDLNGNLTSDGSTTYTYDIENRLTNASGEKSATIKYDPLGRLYETSGGGTTTRFLYDGDALVAEYNSSGAIVKRYVHGSDVDEPLIEYSGSGVNSGSRRNLYADHLGSITAVTNSSGSVLNVNKYDTYGVPDSFQDIGRFAYTGQILIPELDLYYYKARLYAPHLGRFMQTDPVGYADQMNLYAYVGNDPMNAIDPSGEFLKLGKAAFNVARKAFKNGGNFKKALKDEALNLVDNVSTLADGQLTIDDAFAVIDLATGFGGEAKKLTGRCCFVAGTLVDTESGLRPIEEIEVGERVWARDVDTGETALKPVTDLIRRHQRQIWIVELARADGGTSRFETTDDHPWWIPGAGWLKTASLEAGLNAITRAGAAAQIVRVQKTEYFEVTYNITVGDFSTYFVGADRILVHNCPSGVRSNGTKYHGNDRRNSNSQHNYDIQNKDGEVRKTGVGTGDAPGGVSTRAESQLDEGDTYVIRDRHPAGAGARGRAYDRERELAREHYEAGEPMDKHRRPKF